MAEFYSTTKLIPCVYWGAGDTSKHFLTMREIVQERNRLREKAFKYLNEDNANPKCKHIVYYRDRRDANDNVWQVHFYCGMRAWDDEEFYRETANLDGFVGAVHRH